MKVEVVRECHDLFDEKSGPYGFEKVGLNIEGRVVWLCGVMYPHAPKEAYETFQKWESIAEEITKRCRINAPEPSVAEKLICPYCCEKPMYKLQNQTWVCEECGGEINAPEGAES